MRRVNIGQPFIDRYFICFGEAAYWPDILFQVLHVCGLVYARFTAVKYFNHPDVVLTRY